MSRRFIGLIPGTGGGGIDLGLSGNTTGTLATISSGTAILAGGNNVTLSQNGQNITISAGGGTRSQIWGIPDRPVGGATNRDQFSTAINVWPFAADMNMSFSQANALISISLSTSSNSSFSANLSFALGIYTRNGSTLSLASSGSQSYAFSITSTNNSTLYTGVRLVSLPFSANLTPGDYWLAASSNTATTNTNWATVSNYVNSYASFNSVGSFAASTTGTFQMIPGWGQYSVSSAALPTAMGFSEIKASNVSQMEIPLFNLVNFTA